MLTIYYLLLSGSDFSKIKQRDQGVDIKKCLLNLFIEQIVNKKNPMEKYEEKQKVGSGLDTLLTLTISAVLSSKMCFIFFCNQSFGNCLRS